MVDAATAALPADRDNDPALVVFRETLSAGSRTALAAADDNLRARFIAGESVVDLVHLRAAVVDQLLLHLWRMHASECAESAALVAVGGYGRGELHPS